MKYLYFKFRIKPNEEQEELLNLHCDASRFVYNQLLAQSIEKYKEEQKFNLGLSLVYESKKLKKDHEFLKLVNSQSLQQAAMNLGTAFKNRFSKSRKNNTGFPKFKSRRNNRQSFLVPQHFSIKNSQIKLPKIGWIDMIQERKLVGKAKSITIVKDIDQWHASILMEQEDEILEIDPNSVVGIDLGIKTFAITSDGEFFDLPKERLNREVKKLKKLQRRHAKKKKDSKNRNKARIKIAKQYRKISRIKENKINNFVAAIAKGYDIISMENLNVVGMKKNRKLAPSIHQLPWATMKSKFKYKAKAFYEADRWFPSSKTCSSCGYIKKELSLSERTYDCESCGISIDRDLNAAINLRTVATTGLVCGESSTGEIGIDPISRQDLMKQKGNIVKYPNEFIGIQTVKSLD